MSNLNNVGAGHSCMVVETLRSYPLAFFVCLPLHEGAHLVVEVFRQAVSAVLLYVGIDVRGLVKVLVLDVKLLLRSLLHFPEKITISAQLLLVIALRTRKCFLVNLFLSAGSVFRPHVRFDNDAKFIRSSLLRSEDVVRAMFVVLHIPGSAID